MTTSTLSPDNVSLSHSLADVTASATGLRGLALATMVLTTLVALVVNLAVILVILSRSVLRRSVSSYFMLNLFVIDVLSSVTILPIFIVAFAFGRWPWSGAMCIANGALNSHLAFTSILAVCAICSERYFSISSPFRHNLTLDCGKTLAIVSITWIIGAVFSLLPVFGWNRYAPVTCSLLCGFVWDTQLFHRVYILLVVIVFFLLPLSLLGFINCKMYKIAKNVALQIRPVAILLSGIPTININAASPVLSAYETAFSQVSSRQEIHVTHGDPGSVQQQTGRQHASSTNVKALRTLLCTFLFFVLLWGIFFCLHSIRAVHEPTMCLQTLEEVSLWLAYSSYAGNPFVFGLTNKQLKAEAAECLKRWVLCRRPTQDSESEENDDVSGQNDTQDIFQFLERLSHEEPNCVST